MRFLSRFIPGFVLGCVLSFCALSLAGAGHGTYTPLTTNAPMLAIIPEVGFWFALLGTPWLWSAYFVTIPAISWRLVRFLVVAAVAVLHLGTAVLMSSHDEYYARMFELNPSFLVSYYVVLSISLLALGVFAAAGTRARAQ